MNFPLPLIRQLALTLWYADDTTLRAESKEELKSFLMKVQEDEWKSWLKTQHCKNKDHGIWPHHFMANRWGKVLTVTDIYFLGLQNHCRLWLQPCNSKMLAPWKKSYGKPRQCTKKQRHHIADKDPYSQSYYFSSSHVWKWELDHKESWAPKNWCFQTVMLEKTLEHPLDSKEIKPAHPKGHPAWILIGRIDAEAEAPILWPPDAKSWLIGKNLDARKEWRQEEKGVTEDEIVGWHHWLNGHEF